MARSAAVTGPHELAGHVEWAGWVCVVEDGKDDVLGTGVALRADPVRADPLRNGVDVTPRHQLVDETVAEFGHVGVGEAHPVRLARYPATPARKCRWRCAVWRARMASVS